MKICNETGVFMEKKRTVIKVGTSTLTYENGKINYRRVCGGKMKEQVRRRRRKGRRTTVIAIRFIMGKAGLDKRPTETKKKQALAAIGQCELMFMYDKLFGEYNHSVAQLLLTRHAVETEQKRQNVINTIDELLRMNIIPVINENDTVTIDELEGNNFGDNDMLSAIVAGLVAADRLIILTDIDGLYDSNPRTNPNAKKLDIIEKINAEIFEMAAGTGSNRGTGGMITKLQAADYATKRGVEVNVINGSNPENLYEVIDGNKIGTKFLPVK